MLAYGPKPRSEVALADRMRNTANPKTASPHVAGSGTIPHRTDYQNVLGGLPSVGKRIVTVRTVAVLRRHWVAGRIADDIKAATEIVMKRTGSRSKEAHKATITPGIGKRIVAVVDDAQMLSK